MKRTLLLLALAVGGLAAAFLLPRATHTPPVTATQDPIPTAPSPVPVTSNGSLTVQARPARNAFLAAGDELDVVLELEAARGGTQRSPVDFVLVMDRSGSMGGEPLRKAKEAARALVGRLDGEDRLAIVHFGTDVVTGMALRRMDDEGKAFAAQILGALSDDGGTNISGALIAAESILAGDPRTDAVQRIVLFSDGEANEGLEGQALVALAKGIGRQGPRVSALGLGIEFDEDLMFAIAMAAGGQYRYLRNADELAAALSQELNQAAATAATAVRLEVTPAQGVELLDVLGYETSREGATRSFGIRDVAAGETRTVVVRVRASAGQVGRRALLTVKADYLDVLADRRRSQATATASAQATHDRQLVAGSWDRNAAAVGLKARWGMSVIDATRVYERDDVAGATRRLETEAKALSREAEAIGLPSLKDLFKSTSEGFVGSMRSARADSAEGRANRKTLKHFGTDNAGH